MPAVPTPRRFFNAFKRMEVSDFQKRMLEIHHGSPGRTTTAGRMADAMGYSHHAPVCSTYGRLGKGLGKELKWAPENNTKHGIARIAVIERPHGVWRWVMRSEVASAIEKLGWTVSAGALEAPGSDIFEIKEPLVVQYPNGEERLIAELFAHGNGAVFFGCGWIFDKEPAHVLPGPIVKEKGGWRIGDVAVRIVTREEFPILTSQAELWEHLKVQVNDGEATRERAYEILLERFGENR